MQSFIRSLLCVSSLEFLDRLEVGVVAGLFRSELLIRLFRLLSECGCLLCVVVLQGSCFLSRMLCRFVRVQLAMRSAHMAADTS